MANIKKIKIGTTAYDIRDASVPSQISTAIGNLDSSATVASESDGTITIAKSVSETNGKIGDGTTGSTTTNTVAKIDEKDAATLAAAKKYADGEVTKLVGGMVFKGSVGDSGTVTWANLPAAVEKNKGHTYKVITNHSADTKCPACKAGDMIISNGSAWVVIPSGDEPSGTVTSVATGTGLTGGPITTSGTISINRDVVDKWYDATGAATKAVQALDVTNAGNVSAADSSNKVTLKNISETDGKVGVTSTNSAVVYNAAGVDSLIAGAKTYAETKVAEMQVDAGGAHTHSLSVTASCTPQLNPTTKHITASATAPTVTMSDTKFLTGLGTPTKEYLVTDTIAAKGMVTNLSANKDIYNAHYDEATECLELTIVTLTVTKNENAITYATGASTASTPTTGPTTSFVTGYSNPSSAAASVASVTKPTITLADTATSGGVVLLQSVAGATTNVTVSGTATEAGSHSHTLSKKTA